MTIMRKETKEIEAITQESDVKPQKASDLIFTHFVVECSRHFKTELEHKASESAALNILSENH